MRRRLDRWWHRHIVRHTLMETVLLTTIPSPWPEFEEMSLGIIWVTRCLEDDCYWASIQFEPTWQALHV